MRRKVSNYTVILSPEPEGGFTVTVPMMPGCITHGRTLAEAKEMAQDAISCYLSSMKKHKEPMPVFGESFITTVAVPV